MALSKYKLGDLIELCDERNIHGVYNIQDACGMTITKEIIPTKAKISQTDLSNFLIVHPQEFIYNPRTHGKRIGLGYNNTNKTIIISWNNIAFRVKKTDTLSPDYFFIYLNRNEWDREACYQSWGTSTEVFSWLAFCDMEIKLPSLEIQKKYVDLYQAACDNLKAYESRLDSLKLVCDGYIDKLEKSTKVEKIGKYLSLCSETNFDGKYSVDDVRGISIEKKFINTKANMEGVSLIPYLLVKPNNFAYVPVTSRNGGKITIAQNKACHTYIVSSSYVSFAVNNPDILLSDYLAMFFHRPEFDRYARFCSWGSARETFDWDEMCNVKIPIPSIDIQRDIVNIYQCYLERKQIADQMREKIKNLCPVLIRGSLQE